MISLLDSAINVQQDLLYFSPYHKCAATLPWEIQTIKNSWSLTY